MGGKRSLTLLLVLAAGLFATTALAAAVVIPEPEIEPVVPSGEILPFELSPTRTTPVTLRLGFSSKRRDGAGRVSGLTEFGFEVSHLVKVRTAGLPSCPLLKLFASEGGVRRACAGSLLGHGSVTSEIALPGEAPVTVTGRLLAFYAFAGGRRRILARVTTGEPLPLTYVIPFEIEAADTPFATTVIARRMQLIRGACRAGRPNCFADPYRFKGVYENISRFEISLHRLYSQGDRKESFLSAGCPARGGQRTAQFDLAKLNLRYNDGVRLTGVVAGECKVSR